MKLRYLLLSSAWLCLPASAAFSPTNAVVIDSTASISAVNWFQTTSLRTLGLNTPGDGGGGDFYNDGTSCSVDGVTCVQDAGSHYFHRQIDGGVISTAWWGTSDLGVALQAAGAYAMAQGYGHIIVPPGTYAWASDETTTLTRVAAPTNNPLEIDLSGVNVQFGSSVVNGWTIVDPANLGYGAPDLHVIGGYFYGTSTARCGIRLQDTIGMLWEQTSGTGFSYEPGGGPDGTQGSLFCVQNTTHYAENNTFIKTMSINNGSAFNFEINGSPYGSFARQSIIDLFCADGSVGANGRCLWFGDNTSVYDSRITHIGGNWVSKALIYLGSGAKMADTLIDGINVENNCSPTTDCKTVVELSDYPSSNTGNFAYDRPALANVSSQLLVKGSTPTCLYSDASFNCVWPELKLYGKPNGSGFDVWGPIALYPYPTNSNCPQTVCGRMETVVLSVTEGNPGTPVQIPLNNDAAQIYASGTLMCYGGNNSPSYIGFFAQGGSAVAPNTPTNVYGQSGYNGAANAAVVSWSGIGGYLQLQINGTGAATVYTMTCTAIYNR